MYWLSGRSTSSRNRTLAITTTGVDVRFKRPDPEADAALLIYTAMRSEGSFHVVSNGVQTEPILAGLVAGRPLGCLLEELAHENDAPHFMPRICAALHIAGRAAPRLHLGKVASQPGDPSRSMRTCTSVSLVSPGLGFGLHTYAAARDGAGVGIPTFRGDPYPAPIFDNPADTADTYFAAIAPDRRVALVVKTIGIASGSVDYAVRGSDTSGHPLP